VENVVWINARGTVASSPALQGQGTTLAKTSTTAGWNSDAEALNRVRGDGYVEWRFDRLDKRVAAGFAYTNLDRAQTSLNFGIVANVNAAFAYVRGGLLIQEAGTNVLTLPAGSFVVTDTFAIRRAGCRVEYLKNGVVIHRSTQISLGTLTFDTSFFDAAAGAVRASISRCRMEDSSEEDVVWDEAESVSADYGATPDRGSRLRRETVSAGREPGAIGGRRIPADGGVKFQFGTLGKRMAVGFRVAHSDNGLSGLTHALLATGQGSDFAVVEAGAERIRGTFGVADVFSVRRTGTTVVYLKNDSVIYRSQVSSEGSILVAARVYSDQATLSGCRYWGVSKFQKLYWNSALTPIYSGLGGRSELRTGTLQTGATAVSRRPLERTGAVRFRIATPGREIAVGLSNNPARTGWMDLPFAFKETQGGQISAAVSGRIVGDPVSVAPADVFELEWSVGWVNWRKNGSLVFQIRPTDQSPLFAVANLPKADCTLTDCEIAGIAEEVAWRDFSSVAGVPGLRAIDAANGAEKTLSKSAATAVFDSSAISQKSFRGDGYLEFSVAPTTGKLMAGLTSNNLASTEADITYGFFLNISTAPNANSSYEVRQGAARLKAATTFKVEAGKPVPRFKVVRTNLAIQWLVDDLLVHQVTGPAVPPPLFADATFASTGAAIQGGRIYSPSEDSDEDGISDAWEYRRFSSLNWADQSAKTPSNTLVPGFEDDFDRDGAKNLAEFLAGTDPKDYYDGKAPDLRKTSGDNQLSGPNAFVPLPLVVSVFSDATPTARALKNAPLKFKVTGALPLLAESPTGPLVAELDVRTDSQTGQAQVFFKQPNRNSVNTTVTVSSIPGTGPVVTQTFTLSTYELLVHWRFNDPFASDLFPISTTVRNSALTTGFNGTLSGTGVNDWPTLEPGFGVDGTYADADRSVKLNQRPGCATTQFVSGPAAIKQTLATNTAFSVLLWVKLDWRLPFLSEAQMFPLVNKAGKTGPGFDFKIRGGTANGLEFRILQNGVVLTGQEVRPSTNCTPLLFDGRPHLVAFTRDAAGIGRLYIDDREVGSRQGMSGAILGSTNTATLWVGKGTGSEESRFFAGQIDDVRICAAAQRPDEILWLYQQYDSDRDGLADAWERRFLDGSLASAASSDFDTDGATNLQEFSLGLNTRSKDTDGDLLEDGRELALGADPFRTDSDGDGVSDGLEFLNGRNPVLAPVREAGPWNLRIISRLE
jgi:hypothetical protein